MNGVNIKIIDVFFNKENFVFSLDLNVWLLLLIIGLTFLIRYLIKNHKQESSIQEDVELVKIKYKIGGADFEYQITRNYQNIEIAHKIYIELITRKAAIEIEDGKDVIVEIYNSWYSLFKITRDELKSFNGKLLKDNNTSQELILLLTDVLNKGLRPHLTEYQARFRKWYSEQLIENTGKSPQKIQTSFEEYEELMSSMKDVNKTLIEYSKQLKKIIEGKITLPNN
ncbi:hypothetical protein [Tenacibaculum finnmarkense]|uniref:hypothetical protein n=1 Tax=Tenacibaculum finnmarkense TaxID=2781243 RepID=UPI001EFC0A05|nr:hypothetical protein [Tenacibaculum finnmarkense]MCG8860061.1 hypothetical protein [Tenacibaculum finnmarkense]